jgi:hypothetical protein
MRELVRTFEFVLTKDALEALYDCFTFAYSEWERYEDILPCVAEEVFTSAKEFFVFLIEFNRGENEEDELFGPIYKWAVELGYIEASE